MNTQDKKSYLRPELTSQGTIADLTSAVFELGSGDAVLNGVLTDILAVS